MAFIPGSGLIKAEVKWTVGGSDAVNVMWFQKIDGAVTHADLEEVCNAIETDYYTSNLRTQTGNQAVFTGVKATDWTQPNGLYYETSASLAGVVGTGTTPSNVALVASFKTGRTGRSYQGRVYAMGMPEEQLSTNTVGLPVLNALGDALIALSDRLIGSGILHVVASFIGNKVPRAVALITQITSYIVNARVDTQRRRLPKAWS